jgi:LysR family transcriptional regulator, carnitine catabolism transcriptional activator
MEFTTRQLRAFQLVAQHRSFTRAAEALFITPSGLSVLIRELENQVGFRLFDRTTRQVRLTAYGSELLEVSHRSLAELDAAFSRIGGTARGTRQSISLGATPLVSANILPPAIREFRSLRPDLRIQLFDADLKKIMRRVQAGSLDMGLGIFTDTPGIRHTPFFRFALMLIRPQKDGALYPDSMTWAALSGQTLLSLPADNPTQQLIDKHLAKARVECQRGMVVNLLDTQIALVEAGEGIAIIPSFGLPVCRNRNVVMSWLTNPVVHLEFHQISNRGKKLPAGAEEFTDFLRTYVARWAGRAGVL